ncbi:hypothetical protein [Thauera propionica]|jgi:hypothetical protein|uniref:hypothetical protein n=1 Tax=Thauera propionica TaxID=2019431 RepID=UPI0023F5553E|nr:hypothetical protein [Thauera propionica]MDD3676526.1 hypothetical protein [Thauera propionica]
MRTLSAATQLATARRITRPLYLIELGFSPAARFSTAGNVAWSGTPWSGGYSVQVTGMSADGSGTQGGRIRIGNPDGLMGALVLGQGVAGRSVRIWSGDAEALADEDPVLIFDGEMSAAEVGDDFVTLELSAYGAGTLFAPRRFIGPATGFNQLVPAGAQIRVGNVVYTLERAR